jgi:uncharacterized protein
VSETPAFPATTCDACRACYGHRVSVCRECLNEELSATPIDGTGTVYARTTIRVPGSDHRDQEPFDVALVDVGADNPVRVTARLVGDPGPEPGDPVRFVERRRGVDYFEPV